MRTSSFISTFLVIVGRPSAAWVTTAQARFGASLEEAVKATNFESQAPADKSLGWLWSAPTDSGSTRGLGQSITWAWDPALCDSILGTFKEEFFNIHIIECVRRAARPEAAATRASHPPPMPSDALRCLPCVHTARTEDTRAALAHMHDYLPCAPCVFPPHGCTPCEQQLPTLSPRSPPVPWCSPTAFSSQLRPSDHSDAPGI